MFQTKFDRWLIETFVYEHHIKVVRIPEKLPSGTKVEEIRAKQYHYQLIAKNSKRAEALIEQLNDAGAVYTTRIVEGSHWYNPIIFHKSKSFTFRVFWWIVTLICVYYIYTLGLKFTRSDLYADLLDHITKLLNAGK